MPVPQNAAFYFVGHNYKTTGDLIVGRQSASGGFLKGFINHGGTDTICCYADNSAGRDEFIAFVKESKGDIEKVLSYFPTNIEKLQEIGTLFRPGPNVGELAWLRRHFDQRAFSITGITHTVSEAMALDAIGDLLIAPIQTWDALVCSSKSVHTAVTRILTGWADYLEQRFTTRPPLIKMPIIPLGVDSEALAKKGLDFKTRAELRSRMNIADDEIAILYAGRLDHVEKANPVPMLLATEMAQQSSKVRLHLIQAGQASTPEMGAAFKQAAMALAPSVTHHFIDGSMTDIYNNIWGSADIFISLSDNIQESFGLTPIEAMAAGLPCIVSDWNGYRETVRDGKEGLTVPTAAPPPGAGKELSYLYGAGFAGYSAFTGAASQSTAINPTKVAEAITMLAGDAVLRREMGHAGQERAANNYDWRHVITAHQELWSELGKIRKSAMETMPKLEASNARPLRPDPFDIFSSYPTNLFSGEMRISADTSLDKTFLSSLRNSELATPLNAMLLDTANTKMLIERIVDKGEITMKELAAPTDLEQLIPFYLTIGWLAKVGILNFSTDQLSGHERELPFGTSITWNKLVISE